MVLQSPDVATLHDASRPHWSDPSRARPIATRIWAPPEPDAPAPAILLSHGTGGAAEDLDWLAEHLNAAGYLVAAVDHHGNNANDEYLVEGFAFVWERPRDLTFLLDHLIRSYQVDGTRIGAAGFSLGGYTIAALFGARIDRAVTQAVFHGALKAPDVAEFPDFIDGLRASYSDEQLAAIVREGAQSFADPRIRAGFAIVPAIGRMLDTSSLESVTAPFRVRWGGADDIAPPESNALVYLDAIPAATGESVGSDVGHYDFRAENDDPHGARPRVAADALRFFDSVLGASL
ncbi:alpha/beta hydrolase family protein [Brevibacterium linens]|uniref:alpha/beta hydrolase family protein n=1 Tax=Brevibacterium linens TaxID=1703 RepID=UPI003BF4D43E